MTQFIHFYRVTERFGEFSNFAPFPILIGGKIWPTSEHYFQAQKYVETKLEEVIRLLNSPMLAAQMGRDRSCPLRPDWDVVKNDVMRLAKKKRGQEPNWLTR